MSLANTYSEVAWPLTKLGLFDNETALNILYLSIRPTIWVQSYLLTLKKPVIHVHYRKNIPF